MSKQHWWWQYFIPDELSNITCMRLLQNLRWKEKKNKKNKNIVSSMETVEHKKQRMTTIKIIVLKESFSSGELKYLQSASNRTSRCITFTLTMKNKKYQISPIFAHKQYSNSSSLI